MLAGGGAFYTMGAIVYALRRPDPVPGVFGYHEVFHACTVVGATLHFVVIVAYALPGPDSSTRPVCQTGGCGTPGP